MSLRWKQITTAEIDHTHQSLPPAHIKAFQPFEFSEVSLQNRPYLGCAAVLALKHPNPMLGYFWSQTNMAEIAAFIVSQENLNPLNTIFVYDCRRLFRSDFRQIIFEWREHSPKDNINRVKWTAHRILKTEKFRSRELDDFCEAGERLFKILWERQKKAFDSQLKRNPGLHWSLFLLLIGIESQSANFESEYHLAIEIDVAQPGENYCPVIYALCGASHDWKRKIGKSGKSLSVLLKNYTNNICLYDPKTTFCKQCENISKLPTRQQHEYVMNYAKIKDGSI